MDVIRFKTSKQNYYIIKITIIYICFDIVDIFVISIYIFIFIATR